MRKLLLLSLLLLSVVLRSPAQGIPSPKEHFGFAIGDNYQLANFTQTEAWFQKLKASNRVRLEDIGPTEEGRRQYMMIVSAPENLARLEHFKDIAQRLARAELSEGEARALAAEGKAVVWIDGGLHATETVGIHQLIETIWNFVSRDDAETMRILKDAIILFVHANPDGQELVANWYMRNPVPEQRSYRNLPRQYQKYVGHDNNRDFYMMNMKESQNISRQQYVEWMPQIIYNHHQSGPPGSVLAGPPYRDPFNYVYDPLLVTSLDGIGAAMNNRLNVEGKPGYTQRSGSVFSTWWNGGLRTTPYFHNSIGILTEIIGEPNPSRVPLVPARLVPNGATPNPVPPQAWTFRRSIEYSVSLNYAVLDHAVRNKENLLYNIYRMGRNSIERGSRDNWTLSPKLVDSMTNAFRREQGLSRTAPLPGDTLPARYYERVLGDKSLRDARAYVLTADAPDRAALARFINALQLSGVQVHRATAAFSANGKQYPQGSFVVKAAQAYRPHVLDLFEPQDHPNDFQYPGGPPVPPYDAAGWTPAFTMGLKFDRVLETVEAPLVALPYGKVYSAEGSIKGAAGAGFILSASSNAHYAVVNDLLQAGIPVYRITTTTSDAVAGDFFVPEKARTLLRERLSNGMEARTIARRPTASTQVERLRVGYYEPYGSNEPTGWMRWVLEQYGFAAEPVYTKDLDGANLRQRFDVLLFATGTVPQGGARPPGPRPESIPEEFRPMLGRISSDTTVPQLQRFLQDGGRIVAIGSATALAYQLKLPVRNALTEMVNGEARPLPNEKFYIPGSVLQVRTASNEPSTWGLADSVDVVFSRSPAFYADPMARDLKVLAWYPKGKLLRSGWIWGGAYLEHALAAFETPVGKGRFVGIGPEVLFRGQAHGSFRLLFNQLYRLR
ncbi:MAG: peptidase [Chitinophagaceae bacterium]|nr:MAG: peptidase [Chitinophagaceae bacterium]